MGNETSHTAEGGERRQYEGAEQGAHTPGPWKAIITKDGRKLVGVGQENGEGVTDCGFGIWAWGEPEAIANARLIAAAPDMLEALYTAKACLERLDETEKSKTAYGDICAAIAMATASRTDDATTTAQRD